MIAQTFNMDTLAVTDINRLTNESEPMLGEFSNIEEIELLMNAEAANEDFMDIINVSEEDWDAATADGFLIF